MHDLNNHPLFKNDNAKGCHYLDGATRSTQYEASIKPHQNKNNGRYSWLSLVLKCSRKENGSKRSRRQMSLLKTPVRNAKVTTLCLRSLANTETPAS